ncbi:nitroreductase family protein [Allosphingosinicella sp.]|uniref:nitroreductase family protein n=1 Tax=Allosphingosinicella sp. TaxID=2823234 RepID=UPI002EDD6B03
MSGRQADHPVDPLFVDRWSPRAFDGGTIPDEDLLTMFEAARWAPSAFNSQPWRFLYAHRGDPDWERFLGSLVPFNQSWARHSAVLVYFVSDALPFTDKRTGEPTPSLTHAFDTGSAWVSLALQAWKMGYFAHAMSGIDLDKARAELGVPERFVIHAAAAIGRRGDPGELPEKLREREVPSGRRPLRYSLFRGRFRA